MDNFFKTVRAVKKLTVPVRSLINRVFALCGVLFFLLMGCRDYWVELASCKSVTQRAEKGIEFCKEVQRQQIVLTDTLRAGNECLVCHSKDKE